MIFLWLCPLFVGCFSHLFLQMNIGPPLVRRGRGGGLGGRVSLGSEPVSWGDVLLAFATVLFYQNRHMANYWIKPWYFVYIFGMVVFKTIVDIVFIMCVLRLCNGWKLVLWQFYSAFVSICNCDVHCFFWMYFLLLFDSFFCKPKT